MAKKKKSDFISMISDFLMDLPFLYFLIVVLLFVFLNTDVFLNTFMSLIKGTVENGELTNFGVVVNGAIMGIILVMYEYIR